MVIRMTSLIGILVWFGVSQTHAVTLCSSEGFTPTSSLTLESVGLSSDQSEAAVARAIRLLNTFDYSRSWTEAEAREELIRRMPPYAWGQRGSNFANELTKQAVIAIRDRAGKIAFGEKLYDELQASGDLSKFDRIASKAKAFEDLGNKPSLRQIALSVYREAAILSRNTDFSKDTFYEVYRVAGVYNQMLFFAETPIHQRGLFREYSLGDFPRHHTYFESVYPTLGVHPFLTEKTLDHLDVLLLLGTSHFPFGILLQASGFWDGKPGTAAAFTHHDQLHNRDLLSFIAADVNVYRVVRTPELGLLREAQMTFELLVLALTQPTPLRRAIAVQTLFFAKHEYEKTLLHNISPAEVLSQDGSGNPLSYNNFKNYIPRIGELKGLGLLTEQEITKEEFETVTALLLQARERIDRELRQGALP